MSVAKVIEVNATSSVSFQDAIERGIARVEETVENVKGAWVKEQKVEVENGKVSTYRVNMMVTFVIAE
jgi:hypothetical protein